MIATEVTLPMTLAMTTSWFDLDGDSMTGWCETSIGPQALTRDHVDNEFPWYVTSEYNKLIWHFANEEDALLFRLKWGSK